MKDKMHSLSTSKISLTVIAVCLLLSLHSDSRANDLDMKNPSAADLLKAGETTPEEVKPSTEDAASQGSTDDAAEEVIDEAFVDQEVQKQIASLEMKKTGVYWSKPDFSKQMEALGWSPTAFETPPGFHDRVNFWIDIYSKYTTKQVLLHDAKYMDIVYKVLDFTALDADTKLNPLEKERQKKKEIKDDKRLIKEALQRIHRSKDDPSVLSKEDQEIYEKFKFIPDKNKFVEAQGKHRLRMQLGQKDRFILGIYFSGRYIREMEKIFREEKMPIELTRLPFVESTFNLYAMSHVGASGIWQFMRGTGKLFFKIDTIKDPRNDPLEATRAAAKLLRLNYKMLGSWPLALTAYNHGPAGVAAIVKKMKTQDINEMVWNTTRKKFGFASENFFAEFLAALHVESHAQKYFGKVDVSQPLIHEDFALPRASYFGEIAKLAESIFPSEPGKDSFDILRLFNPYFTRPVIANIKKIPADYTIRVPAGTLEKLKAAILATPEGSLKVTGRGALNNGIYKILPGDTLSSIAQEFGVSIQKIKEANSLPGKGLLHPGQRLVIP